MAVWEISLFSPSEISTSWTALTQQGIPCSTHRHVWEICTLKHLKLGKQGQTGGKRREESSDWPWTQPYSQVLLAEKGGCFLQLGEVERLVGTSAGWLAFQTKKGSHRACQPIESPNSSTTALSVWLWSTLPANPRIITTESLFLLSNTTLCDWSLFGAPGRGLYRCPRSPLLRG